MVSLSYKIIRRKGLTATTSINISSDKGVVVRAPFWMPNAMIEAFVDEKTIWIKKHLERLTSKRISKKYVHGEKHLFFGKEYALHVEARNTSGRLDILLDNDKIRVTVSPNTPKEIMPQKIKEALLFWYLETGIEVITEKVNYYAKEIGVNYKKINLKNVSSIWGSCSSSNCLSFNRKLVMAPHEIVDYVVIHEVSHMVHRNHGVNFWKLVEKYDSQFKNHRKWLRQNQHLLAI